MFLWRSMVNYPFYPFLSGALFRYRICHHFRDAETLFYSQINTVMKFDLLYYFRYKTQVFPFKNNPKYLDSSYKMNLHISDCFGREKLISKHKFIRQV